MFLLITDAWTVSPSVSSGRIGLSVFGIGARPISVLGGTRKDDTLLVHLSHSEHIVERSLI